MTEITRVSKVHDTAELAGILGEYLDWTLIEMLKAGGPCFDTADLVAQTLDNLPAYLPPNGHLLTVRDDAGALTGLAFLKRIRPDAAEIKRLYVRPAARGTGLGRALVARLLDTARDMGCARVLIDTGAFMTQALALYRDVGFRVIAPYPESENDPAFAPFLVYMQCDLK